MKRGFLTGSAYGNDPDTSEPYSSHGLHFGPEERARLEQGREPNEYESTSVRCSRGLWAATYLSDRTGATVYRSCKLFFPYQAGVKPAAHLDLKNGAAARWWTFWAVLAATGVGGAVSGVLVVLLS